jgi:hypothetical protein
MKQYSLAWWVAGVAGGSAILAAVVIIAAVLAGLLAELRI